jgi:ZIP family zinc transporter
LGKRRLDWPRVIVVPERRSQFVSETLEVIVYSLLAGGAIVVGGLVARILKLPEGEAREEALHAITALGGGLLLGAVALVLVPKALESLGTLSLVGSFFAGAVVVMLLDKRLATHGGSKGQLLAMLMDFLPEAVALGAVFAHDHRLGILLAFFIGAQNLPEGFNAFRELVASGYPARKALAVMLPLSVTGVGAALAGHLFLADHPQAVAFLMSCAAGGIVYLMFQDIARQSTMKRHWSPPLGAALGFIIGLIGERLIG